MKTKILLTIMAFSAYNNNFIQALPKNLHPDFKNQLCSAKKGNTYLRGLQVGETLKILKGNTEDSFVHFASSFLKSSGKAPNYRSFLPDKCVPPNDMECEPADILFSVAYTNWSCMYTPKDTFSITTSGLEYKPKTAWVEGVKGDGIGEVLIVPLQNDRTMIWSGYAKNKKLFKFNNRPRQIRVFILQGIAYGRNGNYGAENLIVLAEHYTQLKDHFGYQPLSLPNYKKSKAYKLQRRRFIGIEIRSVYKGKKWRDTCISHIFGLKPAKHTHIYPADKFKGGQKELIHRPRR